MTPIPMRYEGDGEWRTLTPRWAKAADDVYVIGEVRSMAPVEERSEVSHRHAFAWLREAWATLPDHLSADFPTAEHLRKRALIMTGWATMADYPCGSKAEAIRWAANMRRESDDYTVVQVDGSVVRVLKARSQARGQMNKADFQASKEAILTWVAGLLEVEPETLRKAA